MERTEWRTQDQPFTWRRYLPPLPVLAFWFWAMGRDELSSPRFWLLTAGWVAMIVLAAVTAGRVRVRLTADGVEVRNLRTRLYRWSDITSVELAPAWDSKAVWLRTRGMHPQAEPDILPLPTGSRRAADTEAEEAVLAIRRRIQPAAS